MNSFRSENLLEEIEFTIKKINKIPNKSLLEESYLAKFLVVFICGTFEEIIKNTFTEKFSKENSLEINSLIDSYLEEKFRNPSTENIISILNKFNEEWGKVINKMPKVIQEAMDYIVTHKNLIAHGHNSDVTLREVIMNYKTACKIIAKIDYIVLGN